MVFSSFPHPPYVTLPRRAIRRNAVCRTFHGPAYYGYANAVFSSRKLEQATYDSVAFRYLAAGSHPDHDTLANFRRRFLDELENLFVQVLKLAQEMKLLKVSRVCLDGTKIHANASKHQALSHGHAVCARYSGSMLSAGRPASRCAASIFTPARMALTVLRRSINGIGCCGDS